MIQVQIASTLERHGVSGVRSVLVEEAAPARAARSPQPGAEVAGWVVPDAGAQVRRASLGVHVACAAVLMFALTAAWWVASAMHGAPRATDVSAVSANPTR